MADRCEAGGANGDLANLLRRPRGNTNFTVGSADRFQIGEKKRYRFSLSAIFPSCDLRRIRALIVTPPNDIQPAGCWFFHRVTYLLFRLSPSPLARMNETFCYR